jgi:hypothetical protein
VEADIPLARLRVTGECGEISEQELAFTLAGLLAVQPPCCELAGWPALVRLAVTSQRTLAQQFLWEEIVGGMRPVEARALLTLALIGRGDSRTVSLICGEQVEVEKLAAKIPLLTVSDQGVVRAHDLWTDSVERLYSQEQIAALPPAVREALRTRHDALRLVTVAELLRDSDTIKIAAAIWSSRPWPRSLCSKLACCLPPRTQPARASDDCLPGLAAWPAHRAPCRGRRSVLPAWQETSSLTTCRT